MAKLSDLNILDVGNNIQLAGAVYIGNGKLYLTMFPDEAGELNDSFETCSWVQSTGGHLDIESLNMSQEEWETFIRQTDLLETQGLVKAENGSVEKAILRKSSRQIDQGVSWKVFRRDGYACRYCRADDVPLTVDHLVCFEEGGPNTETNLVSACRKCNKTRGNTPYAQWLEHPYYKKVSQNLTEGEREANVKLASTLDSIPRHYAKRSR